MASQILTVTKICGAAADAVHKRFGEWDGQRSTANPNEWHADQWPASVHDAADSFADAIRRHRHEPPILFYSEFVDHWTIWPTRTQLGHLTYLEVHTNRYEMACLPVQQPHLEEFMARRIKKGQFQEDRFFAWYIQKAVTAWRSMVGDDGVIVIIRRVVGGTVLDEEVEASLHRMPRWL